MHRATAVQALIDARLSVDNLGNVTRDDGKALPPDSEIDAKLAELIAEEKANEYKEVREMNYPKIGDQLDEIYHNGIDSWKAVIKVTKDKYPK